MSNHVPDEWAYPIIGFVVVTLIGALRWVFGIARRAEIKEERAFREAVKKDLAALDRTVETGHDYVTRELSRLADRVTALEQKVAVLDERSKRASG